MKAEFGGDRHFGDTELRDAVTATHGRVGGRVHHRTSSRVPHVCRFVEVLALDGLKRYEDDHRHVLVSVAQCHKEHFPLNKTKITKIFTY